MPEVETPVPAPSNPLVPAPTPPVAAPVLTPPDQISISPAAAVELARLRALEAQMIADSAKAESQLAEANAQKIAALEAKEQFKEAYSLSKSTLEKQLATEREARQRIESGIAADKQNSVISDALVGKNFTSPGVAKLLKSHFASILETVKDATGQFVSREKGTLRPASEVIAEHLASPDFAGVFAPQGSGGANPIANNTTTPPPVNESPGDAHARAFREYKAGPGKTVGI